MDFIPNQIMLIPFGLFFFVPLNWLFKLPGNRRKQRQFYLRHGSALNISGTAKVTDVLVIFYTMSFSLVSQNYENDKFDYFKG